MGKNELGVTDVIVSALREQAQSCGFNFLQFPLGPHDRHLLSDSLFANNFDQFSLVEMKFSDRELKTERHKASRVAALCRALAKNREMRDLHDRCHMIAWKDSENDELRISPYRMQICNRQVLGSSSSLSMRYPDNSGNVDIDQFGSDLFGEPGQRCLRKDDFKRYAQWLLAVVTQKKISEFEVIAKGRNADNKLIAATMTFDQLCADLAIKADIKNSSIYEISESAPSTAKVMENPLLNGE